MIVNHAFNLKRDVLGYVFNHARKEVRFVDDNAKATFDELAAALNGHDVTDEEGKVEEQTSEEQQAIPEEKEPEVTETNTAEKPEESTEPETHSEEDETEPNSVEDEKGRRYVPEKRFSKIYGEKKALERRLKDLEAQALINQPKVTKPISADPTATTIDKTDLIEIELLKGKLPEFDPDSEQYSPELDELGFNILKANPNLTRMEAAKKALNYAKKFAGDMAQVQAEARMIKTSQSDQGITNRVVNRQPSNEVPDDTNPEAMEAWLRKNGAW